MGPNFVVSCDKPYILSDPRHFFLFTFRKQTQTQLHNEGMTPHNLQHGSNVEMLNGLIRDRGPAYMETRLDRQTSMTSTDSQSTELKTLFHPCTPT